MEKKEHTSKEVEQFQKSIMAFVDPSFESLQVERKNALYAIEKLRERITGYERTLENNHREISAFQRQIDQAISAAENPQEFVASIRTLETVNADCKTWIEKTLAVIKEQEKVESRIRQEMFAMLQQAVKAARPAVIESINAKLGDTYNTIEAWKTACRSVNAQAPGIEFTATMSNIFYSPNQTGRITCF